MLDARRYCFGYTSEALGEARAPHGSWVFGTAVGRRGPAACVVYFVYRLCSQGAKAPRALLMCSAPCVFILLRVESVLS